MGHIFLRPVTEQEELAVGSLGTAAIIGHGRVTASRILQLASAMLLGAVILYGVGFMQTSAVHNAAHDVRHATAIPCH